jgi:hypothetical protein
MPRNRASKAELESRREEIQQLIVKGTTNKAICQMMSEKYKTSKRAIQEDIRKIGQEWAESLNENQKELKGLYEERLNMLFQAAIDDGNIRAALEVQKEIHKINAIYNDKDEKEDTAPKIINIGRKSTLKVVDGGN